MNLSYEWFNQRAIFSPQIVLYEWFYRAAEVKVFFQQWLILDSWKKWNFSCTSCDLTGGVTTIYARENAREHHKNNLIWGPRAEMSNYFVVIWFHLILRISFREYQLTDNNCHLRALYDFSNTIINWCIFQKQFISSQITTNRQTVNVGLSWVPGGLGSPGAVACFTQLVIQPRKGRCQYRLLSQCSSVFMPFCI